MMHLSPTLKRQVTRATLEFYAAACLMIIIIPTQVQAAANEHDDKLGKTEASQNGPFDIYLTGNRLCEQCTWQRVVSSPNPGAGSDVIELTQRVKLMNANGDSIEVFESEIIGVDKHPKWRRALRHSARNLNGGNVVLPGADAAVPR
ncbi:MAG: hypothetical protein VKJ06_01990 [Vampirovibrionales bacterium]|nr:hypothetical protein [Vampirovibrionales bacterium]